MQSPGQNQLGVVEDKVQGNRLSLTRLPTCNLWGYFDMKEKYGGKVLIAESKETEKRKKKVGRSDLLGLSLYQEPSRSIAWRVGY